ncbi:hypothetical protein KKG52_00580 [Patescibacteria group bacterium]|nr:hypothetical protein [Patescibacteria group bacterium]
MPKEISCYISKPLDSSAEPLEAFVVSSDLSKKSLRITYSAAGEIIFDPSSYSSDFLVRAALSSLEELRIRDLERDSTLGDIKNINLFVSK